VLDIVSAIQFFFITFFENLPPVPTAAAAAASQQRHAQYWLRLTDVAADSVNYDPPALILIASRWCNLAAAAAAAVVDQSDASISNALTTSRGCVT